MDLITGILIAGLSVGSFFELDVPVSSTEFRNLIYNVGDLDHPCGLS